MRWGRDMLISSDSFIDMNRDKSYKELLKVRDKLIKTIQKFEKHYRKDESVMQEPSPENIYRHELECLGKLCGLIAEKHLEEELNGNI